MAEKARSTQLLANIFPSWSNIRKDEQSLGFQFLNTLGHRFDEYRKQTMDNMDNYYLHTSVVSDIDVYYRYQLAGSFEFQADPDNTEYLYTPPVVSGFVNDIGYEVTIATNNDIETFWYKAQPTRISLNTTVTDGHFVASGFANDSPLSPTQPSGILHIPNKLTVKIASGSSFLDVYDNGVLRKGLVQITGESREGLEITEELIFLQNETQQTWHDFRMVNQEGIRLYGFDDPLITTVHVASAAFNQDDRPINYELDVDQYKDDTPYFWALGTAPTVGVYTLDLKRYDTNDLELRIQGFNDKHVVISQELQDELGSNIVPLDLAIQPHSSNVWVISATKLYLFKDSLPYADMSALDKKEYDANSVIDPNTYYAVVGEEVEINYLWARPVTGMVAHRAWMQKPDGVKKSLEDGSEVAYHTDSTSWVFGEPLRRQIRDTEFYTLDQRGDYIFSLEVRYADETTSIDQRVITVCYQQALAEFSLSDLSITAVGIDFDSEYKMWILDSAGDKHQIDLHYDNMLVDFKRKVLYFREGYDEILVKES